MNEIQNRLSLLADKDPKYAAFLAKSVPTVDPSRILGVRTPLIRKLASEMEKEGLRDAFLQELPHPLYEEDCLHSVLLSRLKPYDRCLSEVERFLPHVDNWAVCDTLRPRSFEKEKDALLPEVRKWISSPLLYTCRFGVDMLMTYYLDEAFDASYLELPLEVKSEEYYVRMMIAWYYATALAKQWEPALRILEEKRLPVWTHNKTIQKARESFRITPEQKDYLKTLKRV